MKKKIAIGILIYLAGFLLLTLIKFLAIELAPAPQGVYNRYYQQNVENNVQQSSGETSVGYSRKNYATYKMDKSGGLPAGPAQKLSLEQKYERVGSLVSETRDFEKSEKELRDTVKKHAAMVQYEASTGLKGSRTLQLTLGVVPEKFDSAVEDLRKIGTLRSVEINKFDRTSEFRGLNAKRATLEKTLASLESLKNRGGRIEELLTLEKEILDIQRQIGELGVKLGDYDSENEFCTVKVTLAENLRLARPSVWSAAVNSLEWALPVYGLLTLLSVLGLFGIFLLLVILEKLKPLREWMKEHWNKA